MEEYFMGFTVPTSREEIGDPLDKYSVNWYFTQLTTFYKRRKRDKTLVRGEKDCSLNPENRPLVGGQIMRYSEIKG